MTFNKLNIVKHSSKNSGKNIIDNNQENTGIYKIDFLYAEKNVQ